MNSNKKIAKNKKSSSSAKEKKDVKLPVNMDLGIHFLEFLMVINPIAAFCICKTQAFAVSDAILVTILTELITVVGGVIILAIVMVIRMMRGK